MISRGNKERNMGGVGGRKAKGKNDAILIFKKRLIKNDMVTS